MKLTDAQIKGRIRELARRKGADPRVLMRLYMMERFLERVSASRYRDDFIIKGGVLVTSMLGVSLRSTMDIDTSIRGHDLSVAQAKVLVAEIADIRIDDGVVFKVVGASPIMDGMEYPGVRLALEALTGKMTTPVKIDVSTGAVMTPGPVEHEYALMLEDRSISLLSYNVETVLAEKLQTILSRGVLNTRMRDFYDVHALLSAFAGDIDTAVLKRAFMATCESRRTAGAAANAAKICETISEDKALRPLWGLYQQKYPYANDMGFDSVLESLGLLLDMCR